MRKIALPVLFAILVVDAVIASLLYPVFSRYTDGLSLPELWFGVAMFAFSFFQFLSAPALGALSDQRGRSPVFRVAATRPRSPNQNPRWCGAGVGQSAKRLWRRRRRKSVCHWCAAIGLCRPA